MLFQNQDSSLKLEVFNYELPADGGAPDSDDRNWLVLRCTWIEDGEIHKDSNSCLLTYELREMTAGLKVVRAGIKTAYESDFVEPFFSLDLRAEGEDAFRTWVRFFLGRTPPRWSVCSPGSSCRTWWRSWTGCVQNSQTGPERRFSRDHGLPAPGAADIMAPVQLSGGPCF